MSILPPSALPIPPSSSPSPFDPKPGFRADGCKVFAGLAQARPGNLESLGAEISTWLQRNPAVRIVHVETRVTAADVFVWLVVLVFFSGDEIHPTPAIPAHSAAPPAVPSESQGDDGETETLGGDTDDSDEWRLPDSSAG